MKNTGKREKNGAIIFTTKDQIPTKTNMSYTSTEGYLIKGKVIAEDTKNTLAGASIIIKDSHTGTITDLNGEFSLEVKEENIMLSVSFIGYETLVVKAKKGEFLNIVLKRK
ncbi:MAG: hypothetical protein GH151_02235, partial [Bacteroidetes bacterium]|nr:hypothetical protein [Bacteroidota bacterium]